MKRDNWRTEQPSAHRKAFFSFDAAMALVLAVFSFVSLASIGQSSALFAQSDSLEVFGTNLALRLSTYVLSEAGAQTGGGMQSLSATYILPGELDIAKLPLILPDLLSKSGHDYASISVEGKLLLRLAFSAGTPPSKVY